MVTSAIGIRNGRETLIHTADHAMVWVCALIALATIGLTFALVDGDLSLRYVAEQITLNMPRPHKAASLWAGDVGRRVTFAFVLSVLLVLRGRHAPTPRAVLAAAAVVAVAIGWSMLGRPFEQLPWRASEGSGLALPQSFRDAMLLGPIALTALGFVTAAAITAFERDHARRATTRLLLAWVASLLALALGVHVVQRYRVAFWSQTAAYVQVHVWVLATAALLFTPLRRVWWPVAPLSRRVLGFAGGFATLLVAAGIFGYVRTTSETIALGQGQSATVQDARGGEWSFVQQGVSTFRAGNREVVSATLAGEGANAALLLVPERSQFVDSQGEEIGRPIAVTAQVHGVLQSVRATLLGVAPNETASLRLEFALFQSWLWLGVAGLVGCAAIAWYTTLRRT